MFLEKVAIKNFRSFDETGVELVFNSGINAIVGENNTGKSAVIDALRIVFTIFTYGRNIYFKKSDFHIGFDGKRASEAKISLFFKEVPEYLIEILDPLKSNEGEMHLVFSTEVNRFGDEKVKLAAWGGKVEGNKLTTDTLEAISMFFLGALRDVEDEMKPSRTNKLSVLLNSIVEDEQAKQEVVDILTEANKTIQSKEIIKQTKDIINKNLLAMEKEILNQEIEIGFADPKFESFTSALRAWFLPRKVFLSKENPIYENFKKEYEVKVLKKLFSKTDNGVVINLHRLLEHKDELKKEHVDEIYSLASHTFELHQNGLGYNNLLFISTVLGDMSLNKKGILLWLLLIEEPEAHLHPQLQELVHNFFEDKSSQAVPLQVIYTSHSPTLVSKIGIDSINILFERENKIKCFPLANAQLKEPDQAYLRKFLDVTKSKMFFSKGIIFVEGISEALLLPELAILLKRPLNKYAVEVVNINGTAFKPFANLLKAAYFSKTAVITDDDRCTDKTNYYIGKDVDYDCDNIDEIIKKIEKGSPSDRFKKIKELCEGSHIKLCSATITLEYELALFEKNLDYILEAVTAVYKEVGEDLKKVVEAEEGHEKKAARVWLFIRYRGQSKGQIVQYLCNKIKNESTDPDIATTFVVPEYIKQAIYAVTEEK